MTENRRPKRTDFRRSKRTDLGKSKSSDFRKSRPAGQDSEIRLNRYIAGAGICSRRQADQYILAGLVSVNGRVIDKLGIKVNPGDRVSFNGKIIKDEKKVYILMNKPKDCVTTVDDPGAKFTVMDILGKKFAERVYPVGRLDRDTTGVLLFTNDGDLTLRLTHPSYNKKKIYHVFLNKNLTYADLVKISKGLALEDGFIRPDAVHYADKKDKSQVGIELHSGKNRIVKRIFEAGGYKILKLDRVYFAGLTKKGLNRGQWRFLTEKEISMLKMNAYE
jgi:23S rRNA pseudouridine2605 synthase